MSQEAVERIKARSLKEPYNAHMGIKLEKVEPGRARVSMKARPEMANMFGKVHGGATFSLLDAGFQYACNSHGKVAVALELSIYYLAPAEVGQRLVAEVTEIKRTRKTALYEAVVKLEPEGTAVCRATALAYRVGSPIPLGPDGELTEP